MTQPLQDAEAVEEGRVCFSCELSHEDEEVEWSLNGTTLYNDSFHEITHEGRRHTLVLKRVRRADAGTIRASSLKVSASARLEVRGEASQGVLSERVFAGRGGSSLAHPPMPFPQQSQWCS